MKRPRIPSMSTPNTPQAPAAAGNRSMSAMYTTPLHTMFAPLSSGTFSQRAGRKSLLGS